MHPYRPFAAAWRRRRIATASPAPQRGYHGATTRLLRELLRGYYEATTRLLRGYYEATTRPLPGHYLDYQATTRLPRGYYQEPHARHSGLGQQHNSGSTARLPAPLTPATRSRRLRSAHQWKDLEEAVLHMPNKLDNSEDQARHISSCSRMQLVCSPACTPTSPTKTSTPQASRPGPSGT
jgi:hypothetical protein